MHEFKIDNLPDFVKAVQSTGDIIRGVERPILFWRGQLAGESLLPSVFRGEESPAEKSKRETRQALRFQASAAIRGSAVPATENHAKWLFLMQHSGLPTRLLDWSESPLVAAFFAVEERGNAQEDQKDAVIWLMNPMVLNQVATVAGRGGLHSIQSPTLRESAAYAFDADNKLRGKVYALGGFHDIVQHMTQLSCFTIHGNDHPLENHPKAEKFLTRFVIPACKKSEMRMDLARVGIRRDILFPDFFNLAREIKESDALFPTSTELSRSQAPLGSASRKVSFRKRRTRTGQS